MTEKEISIETIQRQNQNNRNQMYFTQYWKFIYGKTYKSATHTQIKDDRHTNCMMYDDGDYGSLFAWGIGGLFEIVE